MLNTCLNVSGCRHNCIRRVNDLLYDFTGDAKQRITEMYSFAGENVRECMEDCDNSGRVTLCPENGEEFKILCPLRNKDCGYWDMVLFRAKMHALKSLSAVIPKRIQKRLGSHTQTSALTRAQMWDFSGILYLSGDTGLGKSFCAAWLLYDRKVQQLMKKWDNENLWGSGNANGVAWVSAYSAVDRANFELVKNVPILVLDDLGREAITPVNKATIGEIISKRYDNDVPTIITSNLKLTGIETELTCERVYGRHIVDRIIQSGQEIQFKGASMRVSAA